MKKSFSIVAALAALPFCWNCGVITDPAGGGAVNRQAAIVGQIVDAARDNGANNNNSNDNGGVPPSCPEVIVTVNGSPVDIVFDDLCSFLVSNVDPVELMQLGVEVPALGLTGTIDLAAILEDELIEILVVVSDDSLSITVVRRAAPDPADVLPELICDNNVSIELAAGLFQQNLAVYGNRFMLLGQAGEVCSDDLWTVIEGNVLIHGNKATFRNIKFVGNVDVHGNAVKFINCCFDDALVNFGTHGGDDDDDDNGNSNSPCVPNGNGDDDDDDGDNGNNNNNNNNNSNGDDDDDDDGGDDNDD